MPAFTRYLLICSALLLSAQAHAQEAAVPALPPAETATTPPPITEQAQHGATSDATQQAVPITTEGASTTKGGSDNATPAPDTTQTNTDDTDNSSNDAVDTSAQGHYVAPKANTNDLPFQDDEDADDQSDAEQNGAMVTDTQTPPPVSVDEKAQQIEAYKASIHPEDFRDKAKLQALNKITARAYPLEAEVGKPVKFGNLTITLKRCWKAPQDQEPESKALLDVWEQVPGEEKKEIFYGWMFASSPSLSAMEHPVYDVRVLECEDN